MYSTWIYNSLKVAESSSEEGTKIKYLFIILSVGYHYIPPYCTSLMADLVCAPPRLHLKRALCVSSLHC